MWRYLAILLFPLVLSGQSQTPGRDLRIEANADFDAARPAGVPVGYALIIGISVYQNLDAAQSLEFPESDAEAMYRVLISREGGAFASENVHKLLGKQATIANIRRELEEWLPSVAKPEDRVVVYFAGHGVINKNGGGYLAAWDLRLANLESTAYSMTALGDVMANKVKARWKVLLSDACHSGKINPVTTDELIDAEIGKLPKSFLTLTATRESESSYEDKALSTGFGLFTYFLVQAWSGYADIDCDGRITADEVIEYVRSGVRRYAKNEGISQTPTEHGAFDSKMLLGVSLHCLNTASNSPEMLGSVTISKADMEGIFVYLDGKLVGPLSTSQTLHIPDIPSGLHQFEATREGYEPDRQEILVPPGQDVPVTFRIRYQKVFKKAAMDLDRDGEKLLSSHQSVGGFTGPLPSQNEGDLKKARDKFKKALVVDPKFSKAAFHLGQVNQLLSDRNGSIRAYLLALEIDENYVDARIQYAAILIEDGDVDEAIRHLTEALRLENSNDEAYSFLARAYWDKGEWDLSIKNADHAIQLNSSNHQAYLWKADALRHEAVTENNSKKQIALYEDALQSYLKLLSLTNFDSTPPLEWVAFHFIGFGLGGGRRHAVREDSFNATRVAGFLGVCISEQQLGNLLNARLYCRRAVKQDSADPIAYYASGNVSRDLFNKNNRCEYLKEARDSYAQVVKLNAHIDEAKYSRDHMKEIDDFKIRC